ncbi:amino acid permease/ SLC12A domain-containing protein [Pyronema omphalodes]|nr:amino acid permease/ SLC12A domain-containing protein [Pyronema omphalodes]
MAGGDAEKGGNLKPADEQEIRLADVHHDLTRGLKARHITMIAIGGAIGTGLIIGTGSALAQAGPAAVLISYTIVGFLVYLVMCALGEMAAWLPLGSGFTGYATRFCDPALGFAMGWTYWFKYIIVTPNQLTATSLVIQYWVDRKQVNPGVWITIFLVTILFINYFGIRLFGEIEFWLSSFKVITIVALIILSLILALGGGPDHDRKGFRYWNNPGAFRPYIAKGPEGIFLAIWSTFVTATFAYLGTELVGVTVGEAQNPRRTIPRAIRLTFYRILVFYILSVFLLGMIVPYDSKDFPYNSTDPKIKSAVGASASPYVVALKLSGIDGLPHVLNACILVFVFSASNSDLYIASRTLYGLALEGKAPKLFARTDRRGVPIYALGTSALFALLAYMNVAEESTTVFKYFVNLTTIFGILTWISILVTHIFFLRARRAQGVTNDQMAYVSPFGMGGSIGALIGCCLIAIFKNFNVFTYSKSYGKFDYKNFITGYIGIPLYLGLILGYKIWYRQPGIAPHEADLFAGKEAIDREEEEFLRQQAARGPGTKAQQFYRKWISWLF